MLRGAGSGAQRKGAACAAGGPSNVCTINDIAANTTVTVAAVDVNVRPIPLTSTVKLPPSLSATG